jgi:hypothetical protein
LQPPQFEGSDIGSTQPAEQQIVLPKHLVEPLQRQIAVLPCLMQISPGLQIVRLHEQTWVTGLQLAPVTLFELWHELVVRQPQLPLLHAHAPIPPRALQLLPHAPQLLVLVATSVSQPSSGMLNEMQSAKPELQVSEHCPPVQLAGATPFAVEHALPH